MEKRYLIHLSGMGDLQLYVVDEKTFRLVTSPESMSHEEKIEVLENIWSTMDPMEKEANYNNNKDYFIKSLLNTRSANDRALQLYGHYFDTISEYQEYLDSKNIEIVDEYYGMIY
ncbi:hypothetical protein [Parageobacillus galactosidasius]|uniref:Uncharacterized protein n=1 Tax=Parageobacillus galactosidasius TaxID=883812 RepID=A0A226QTR1_9BACL|nr:hypothetical protein [Parageobacillus galactosidasius]OXB94799.1 hypothetical protein B9L23_08025 [Parageobacillus galactosidasius]